MEAMVTPISVIMPVYLGYFSNAAVDRAVKFERAVKSFIKQDYPNKRLLIVADGCEDTVKIYQALFADYIDIVLIKIEKQEPFSGNVRQVAMERIATGVVTYLDSDDEFLNTNHLSAIMNGMISTQADWVYADEYIGNANRSGAYAKKVIIAIEKDSIGTSSVSHKVIPGLSWSGCNGYGHDWEFVQRLKALSNNYHKIDGTSYHICHIPNQFEC